MFLSHIVVWSTDIILVFNGIRYCCTSTCLLNNYLISDLHSFRQGCTWKTVVTSFRLLKLSEQIFTKIGFVETPSGQTSSTDYWGWQLWDCWEALRLRQNSKSGIQVDGYKLSFSELFFTLSLSATKIWKTTSSYHCRLMEMKLLFIR